MDLKAYLAAPFRQPKRAPKDAPVLAMVLADDSQIAEFRSMIDKGLGGASGLSAATRRDALAECDRLAAFPQGEAHLRELAQCMGMGVRTQGAVVASMISAHRGAARA